MERSDEEKAGAQESARGGARPLGWFGPQRGERAREQTERPQGTEEGLNAGIARIRARFGYLAIGLGNGGIRYSAPARH